MQFQIGERVVHPMYGVGIIKTFTKQQFAREEAREYYEVTVGGVTVWVPINDKGSTVLRGIAPKDSLNKCRRVLKSHPVPLNKDRQLRQLQIANRLKGRLLPALSAMVRDLRAHSREKPLSVAEGEVLKKISKALCDEWAASEGVTTQTALYEIESLLQQAHPA